MPLSPVSRPSLELSLLPPRSRLQHSSRPGETVRLANCAQTNETSPALIDLPPVKPSAVALGTIFSQTAELAVLSPLFGQTYQRAKLANTKEEFAKSKEASGAAIAWGTTFVGSALQAYGVGALINATGTLSYKGAAYLGGLIFLATAAPGVS